MKLRSGKGRIVKGDGQGGHKRAKPYVSSREDFYFNGF